MSLEHRLPGPGEDEYDPHAEAIVQGLGVSNVTPITERVEPERRSDAETLRNVETVRKTLHEMAGQGARVSLEEALQRVPFIAQKALLSEDDAREALQILIREEDDNLLAA
jgi:hypothetical protein